MHITTIKENNKYGGGGGIARKEVMAKQPTSAMFKEVFYNPNSNNSNLIIIDRTTGTVQKFTLEGTHVEYRLKYAPSKEELESQKEEYGDSAVDPEDVWGVNGWSRMRRMEMAE